MYELDFIEQVEFKDSGPRVPDRQLAVGCIEWSTKKTGDLVQQLIECVPNFSEGRDMAVMKQITDQVESVDGVKLLDVDPGSSTNRTVVTFVGSPDAVCEAAFRAAKKAAEMIDMTKHKGEHPRFGAMDVCPLIPLPI